MGLENILFLSILPPRHGGGEYTSQELVSAVASRGLTAEVIAESWEGDKEFDRLFCRQTGVQVHRLPYEVSLLSAPPSGAEVQALSEYITDFLHAKKEAGEMPDIVVVSNDKLAWYNHVIKEFGLPVVQHLMGTPMNAITQGIYSPKKTREYLGALAVADHIVCIASHFKELVLDLVPNYAEECVSVIHNEVDTTLFSPGPADNTLRKALDLPPEAIVIVHTSIFRPVKRVEDIVASAREVLKERDDVYYLLVGDTSRAPELVSAAGSSEYADHFRLPGSVAPDLMPMYLKQGAIFILSSQTEGLPRAAMEAQACGLYLIVSDCAAGRELTAAGTLGSIYPVGDVSALAQTTLQVLDMDRARFDEIRMAGRDAIVKNCSKGVQMQKYMNLLKRIYQSARRT